jgi:hypothetical protein
LALFVTVEIFKNMFEDGQLDEHGHSKAGVITQKRGASSPREGSRSTSMFGSRRSPDNAEPLA